MIDYFTLALTHGLIALALWRLVFRPELDTEDGQALVRQPWIHKTGSDNPQDPKDD